MPFINWDDAEQSQDATPGQLPPALTAPVQAPTERPGFLDTMAAAFRQNNVVSAGESRVDEYLTQGGLPDFNPAYDPASDPQTKGQDFSAFIRSGSPEETSRIIQRRALEDNDRKTLADAGFPGFLASLAAGTVDPITLASFAVPVAPEIAVSRIGRVAAGALANAGLDTADESLMHNLQETRTLSDSIERIAPGIVLNSVFGALATRVPKDVFEQLRAAVDRDHAGIQPSTAGARAVGDDLDLEDESIARGGVGLAKTLGKVSPHIQNLLSPVKETRQLSQDIVDTTILLNKHLEGKASGSMEPGFEGQTIEGRVRENIFKSRHEVINNFESSYTTYKDRVPSSERLTAGQFGLEVSKAMNLGDKSDIPEVAAVASKTRKMFDRDLEMLQNLGVIPKDFELVGAESYFPRVWDRDVVMKNQTQLESILHDHYSNNPLYDKKAAEDILKEHEAAIKEEEQAVKDHSAASGDLITHNQSGALEAAATTRKTAADSVLAARAKVQSARDNVVKSETKASIARRQSAIDDRRLSNRIDKATAADTPVAKQRVSQASVRANRSQQVLNDAEQAVRDAREEHKAARAEHDQAKADHAEAKKAHLEEKEKLAELQAKADAAAKASAIAQANTARLADAAEKARTPRLREPDEIKDAVRETMENILGSRNGQAEFSNLATPKPLKQRKLDVPYDKIKDFLVHDFEGVMQGYLRAVHPQIQSRLMKLGPEDFKIRLDAIDNQYRLMQDKAKTNAEKALVSKHQQLDHKRLNGLYNRVMGLSGKTVRESNGLVKAARLFRAYNYVTSLGGQTLSSLSDYGHIISRYGLTKTMARTARFLTDLPFNKMTRENAKRWGTALEWEVDSRTAGIGDLDLMGSGGIQRFAQKATQNFSRVTGMATWNSSLKAITASLEQDLALKVAERVGSGAKVNAYELGILARNGLSKDMLERVATEISAHGEKGALWRARTDLWSDKEAGQAFETAIGRAADSIVPTIGKGDLPLLMDREDMKLLLQFKSFGISSVSRITIPLAQGLSHAGGFANSASGLGAMLTLGGMTYMAKEYAANRAPDMTPSRLVAESLNWSGVLAMIPDIYDPLSGLIPGKVVPKKSDHWFIPTQTKSGHVPRFSKYEDRSPIDTALGPTMSAATSILGVGNSLTADDGKGVTAKDIHNIRKLLPWQNLVWFRRVVNALEGETAEATNAKGATHQSFGERVAETKPPEKQK